MGVFRKPRERVFRLRRAECGDVHRPLRWNQAQAGFSALIAVMVRVVKHAPQGGVATRAHQRKQLAFPPLWLGGFIARRPCKENQQVSAAILNCVCQGHGAAQTTVNEFAGADSHRAIVDNRAERSSPSVAPGFRQENPRHLAPQLPRDPYRRPRCRTCKALRESS